MQALIIEDEAPARRLLTRYVNDAPGLHLTAALGNALEGLSLLESGTIDLLLLDIHLPRISGLDLLRTLRQRPAVILTTAYPEHALESYELDVVDYLLKPFSFTRFLRAVNKVKRTTAGASSVVDLTPVPADHFFVRSDKVIHRVAVADLVYCKAEGDFVRVVLRSGQLLVSRTLTDMAEELSGFGVVRTHRSYLLRVEALTRLEGNRVFTVRGEVPVGRTFRVGLLERLS